MLLGWLTPRFLSTSSRVAQAEPLWLPRWRTASTFVVVKLAQQPVGGRQQGDRDRVDGWLRTRIGEHQIGKPGSRLEDSFQGVPELTRVLRGLVVRLRLDPYEAPECA
jgi:hypothetical protein